MNFAVINIIGTALADTSETLNVLDAYAYCVTFKGVNPPASREFLGGTCLLMLREFVRCVYAIQYTRNIYAQFH